MHSNSEMKMGWRALKPQSLLTWWAVYSFHLCM